MITGGSSSGVAVAVQALCQEAGVIYMAGLTHANDTTGKDKRANGFRHFFNSYMSGAALAPILIDQYGADRKAYHLTADYNWGYTTEQAVRESTEATRLGDGQHRADPARRGRLLLLHRPRAQLGRRRAGAQPLRRRHGEQPHQRRPVRRAPAAGQRQAVRDRGAALLRAHGPRRPARTSPASWARRTGTGSFEREKGDRYTGTDAFVQSFGTKYGFPPSQAAHTGYVQALLYADAVTRAGSFAPCAVVEALKDYEFDGHGQRPHPLPRRGPPVLQGRWWWCAARRTPRTSSTSWRSSR